MSRRTWRRCSSRTTSPTPPRTATRSSRSGRSATRPRRRSNRMDSLQLSGVCKQFGDFVALKEVNLAVHQGELICFLGPSGCGKTTLLRIIAGLEVQTAGTIVQNGRDISRLPPMQRDYGIVFQSYALFPNLSVAENVAYG